CRDTLWRAARDTEGRGAAGSACPAAGSGVRAPASDAAAWRVGSAATGRCAAGRSLRTAVRSPRRPGARHGRSVASGDADALRSAAPRRGRRRRRPPSFLVLGFVLVVVVQRQAGAGLVGQRGAPVRLAARVPGRLAELLLDAEQLVVLGRPLTARGGAGLDLAGVHPDREVGDRRVLGL